MQAQTKMDGDYCIKRYFNETQFIFDKLKLIDSEFDDLLQVIVEHDFYNKEALSERIKLIRDEVLNHQKYFMDERNSIIDEYLKN